WSLILFRIVWIEFLDVQVLHVRSKVSHTPRNAIVMSENDARQSRHNYTRHAYPRRIQMDHMPNRWRGRRQMRIVCKQWFAGDGVFTAHDPIVAGGEGFSVKADAIQCGGSDFLVVGEPH